MPHCCFHALGASPWLDWVGLLGWWGRAGLAVSRRILGLVSGILGLPSLLPPCPLCSLPLKCVCQDQHLFDALSRQSKELGAQGCSCWFKGIAKPGQTWECSSRMLLFLPSIAAPCSCLLCDSGWEAPV